MGYDLLPEAEPGDTLSSAKLNADVQQNDPLSFMAQDNFSILCFS